MHPCQSNHSRTKMWLLLFLALSALCGAAPAGESQKKIDALVITGGHGFDTNSFFQVFKDNAELKFSTVSHGKNSATAYEEPGLLDHDVIILYDLQKKITEEQKAKFLSLFDQGIGLLVLHHALVSYQHWPDYERIIGGRYPEAEDKSGVSTAEVGYQHDVEFPVVIVAKNHPVTAGLRDFTITDEIYWGYRTGADVTPLITTTLPKSGKPLGWARTEGKSRVVYLQLGHGPSAFNDPNYRKLVAQSIRWVARR